MTLVGGLAAQGGHERLDGPLGTVGVGQVDAGGESDAAVLEGDRDEGVGRLEAEDVPDGGDQLTGTAQVHGRRGHGGTSFQC